jgi:hypothetical protein
MEIIPIESIEKMANIGSKSGLFGIKTMEQAAALMLISQAEGIHPAMALRDYHVINTRPTLKSDAMLARFQAAGGRVKWHTLTDVEAAATFTDPWGGEVKIAWTIEMAKRAGLANKDTWKQYPRAMLRTRVISEGIRSMLPGVVCGVYTPEEVGDFADALVHATSSQPKLPEPVEIQATEVESTPLGLIQKAATMDELRAAFTKAVRTAKTPEEKAEFTAAKDARKLELEKGE